LLTLSGDGAKIAPAALEEVMRVYTPVQTHHIKPCALSLTQATESGCVYSVAEVQALGAAAKSHGLKIHMDGARFSNAVAALGCTPAQITWRAGVDVLCFGATKNGALAAEAVVFFNPADTEGFAFRHKRSGHVWSKGRFMAAQWSAFLADGLWLDLAGHANAMAARLSQGLRQAGCQIVHETEINEVFVVFPDGVAQKLQTAGAQFYDWVYPGDKWDGRLKRLVTNYVTTEEEVDRFLLLL
jgi:threonine aldolase